MGGNLLLDTNAMIALIAGDSAFLAAIQGCTTYAPIPALAELYYGAEKSSRVATNIEKLERYAAITVVLPLTEATARQWGKLRNELRLKGKPIPMNDIWIAATAVENNLPLLTRDAHFNHVDGLQTLSW
jgi:tRNA(fMet)-specific endonuclease VapC